MAGLSGRKHLLKRGAEFRPLPLLGDESGKVVREVEAMKRRALAEGSSKRRCHLKPKVNWSVEVLTRSTCHEPYSFVRNRHSVERHAHIAILITGSIGQFLRII